MHKLSEFSNLSITTNSTKHLLYWWRKLKGQLYWTIYGTKTFSYSKWSKSKQSEAEKIVKVMYLTFNEFIKVNHNILLPILTKLFIILLQTWKMPNNFIFHSLHYYTKRWPLWYKHLLNSQCYVQGVSGNSL